MVHVLSRAFSARTLLILILGLRPISANLFDAITAGVCLAGVRAIARGIGDVLVGRPNWRRSGSNE